MTNTQQPTPSRGVAIELDRTRYLRFPLGVLQQLSTDEEKTSFSKILYLGLRGHDPDLTEEKVADLIDLEMLPALREPLKKATGGLIDLKSFFSAWADEDDGTVKEDQGDTSPKDPPTGGP